MVKNLKFKTNAMDIRKSLWKKISLPLILLLLGSLPMIAQTVKVDGKVIDINGEGLPGVNISLKGGATGTITNLDGFYSIDVAEAGQPILVFSYIGYKSVEILLNSNQRRYDVVLEEGSEFLDEVVVVAYGVQKKANLTGAVSSLRVNDIKDIPVSNTASLLQGRMSGVTVSSFSSQPGKDNDVEIRIRGIGTFGNSNPLVLIDGVEGALSSVSPNDIENISVLKDASSAAIYGVRAANGVILVTTKRGTGANKLSYNASYGVQSATILPSFLDSWKWATLFNEQNNALEGNASDRNYTPEMIEKLKNGSDREHFSNTNWMKEVFRTAPIQNHYLSMTGGGQSSNYMASLGYMKQDGIMKGTDTERVNFRLNSDSKYLNIITLGLNTAGSYQRTTEPLGGIWKIFNQAVDHARPTIPVKYNNGQWGQYDGNPNFPMYQDNPLELTTLRGNENVYKFDGKAFLDVEPIKNLHFKTSFAYQYNSANSSAFEPTYNHYRSDGTYITSGIAALEESRIMQTQWINENLVTYNLNLSDDHSFGFLVGQSSQYNGNKYSESKGEGFLNNNVRSMDAAQTTSSYGREETATLRSFFGRINYAYQSRYLFEVNLRRDESSRIPKKNRTGYFPSVSAGWNIAEESFLKEQNTVNLLKLRASWGKLGNQDIGFYPYSQTYALGQNNYVWGSAKVLGAALASAANPDIKWETTTTTNVGLDVALLKNKISLTLDYFNKVSSDILLKLPVSGIIGVNEAPYVNAAEVKNAGWEVNLGYNDRWNDFTFGANFNFSHVRNEITSVNGREDWIDGWTINLAGNPIGAYYGYKADGLYTSQEQIDDAPVGFGSPRIGDVRYMDISGPDGRPDGEITDHDRTIIGNPFPKISYSFNLTAGYKNVDFSAFFQGVGNVDRIVMDYPSVGGGATEDMWNRFHATANPNGTYPGLGNVAYNSLPSSFWIKNASYLRLKNIEMGYSFSKEALNKAKIQGLRVFVSAQNLLTFTGINNYDPEKYATDSRNWTYPNAKTFSVGLNINL
jgi:TonB-linked outer membrane protein, SusC/RagA family